MCAWSLSVCGMVMRTDTQHKIVLFQNHSIYCEEKKNIEEKLDFVEVNDHHLWCLFIASTIQMLPFESFHSILFSALLFVVSVRSSLSTLTHTLENRVLWIILLNYSFLSIARTFTAMLCMFKWEHTWAIKVVFFLTLQP